MTLYLSGVEQTGPARADGSWSTPYMRWRLAAEREAMQRFPGFWLRPSEEGILYWAGFLESGLPGGGRYLVHVAYPTLFPDEPPAVTIEAPRLEAGTPHLLGDSRPCLYRQGDGHGYDAARTTAATLVAWTALWIHAYETWLATGSWPGSQA